MAALEALDRGLGAGAEDAVDGDAELALQEPDAAALATRSRAARGRAVTAAVRGAAQRGHVAGPTMPSAVRPWRRWKRLTARFVPEPKMPSAWTPSQRCAFSTRGPFEPFLSGFAAPSAVVAVASSVRRASAISAHLRPCTSVFRKSVRVRLSTACPCAYEVS